ncbi:MAG: substrate-binding domain-containing protein [Planctomycetota bacterium]|nr:substrate-binding domain-containing protein [Planctomycetota bacterium]
MCKPSNLVRAAAVALAILAATALPSCKRMTGEKQSHADQLYIQVSALGGLDYFYDHKLGMELAGKALGVQTDYVGPATYDMSAMVTALEQAIARKPDGLVVVGFEDSLNPIVDKAVAAGIPVVTVDADLPQSRRVAFVGTGNVRAGYEIGKKLSQVVGKGKVALLYKPGQSNLEERRQGFKKALAENPQIEFVDEGNTQSDPIKAAQAAASLLQLHPDLAGFGCIEAEGGAGSATAVKEAGKVGQVKVVSMDRGGEVLKYIQEGVIQASVAQQTALMPFYAVQILYNLRNNPAPISTDNAKAGVSGAPVTVDTGVIIIDKDNCSLFVRAAATPPAAPATRPASAPASAPATGPTTQPEAQK